MKGPVIDETTADLAALGVVVDVLPEKEPEGFDVFPENWKTIQCFCACETQWRIGMSGRTGLDYTVLFQVMDLYAIEDKAIIFEDIRIMESVILRESAKD